MRKICQVVFLLFFVMSTNISVEAAKVAVIIDGPINTMKEKSFNKYVTKTIKRIYANSGLELVQLKDSNDIAVAYRSQKNLNDTGYKSVSQDYYYKESFKSDDLINIGEQISCQELMYISTDWAYSTVGYENSTVDLMMVVQVYDIQNKNMVFEEMIEKSYDTYKAMTRFGGGVRFGSEYRTTLNKALEMLSYKPAI